MDRNGQCLHLSRGTVFTVVCKAIGLMSVVRKDLKSAKEIANMGVALEVDDTAMVAITEETIATIVGEVVATNQETITMEEVDHESVKMRTLVITKSLKRRIFVAKTRCPCLSFRHE